MNTRVILALFFCIFNLFSKSQESLSIQTKRTDYAKDIQHVKLINWNRFRKEIYKTPQQELLGKVFLNTNKYALATWWLKHGFEAANNLGYLNLKGVTEHFIRPVAAEAEALAVSLRIGLYNETIIGVSYDAAEAKAIQLVKSLAHVHLANSVNGWGRQWQSALWAGYTASAGWMLWDKLDEVTRKELLAMIYDECDWVMHNKGMAQIKLYRDMEGHIISPGDTGTEENAWDGSILAVAVAMMPHNPLTKEWMHKLLFLYLHALSRPSDVHNHTKYNGRKLSEWLVGTNMNEDGTLVNHHFIHPDYMASSTEFNPAKYFLLSGRKVPKAFTLNIETVFHAFADLSFRVGDSITGGIVKAPGGTIFKKSSGDIYYPLGTDWGQGRRMNFVMFNTVVAFLSKDITIRKQAQDWVLRQAQVTLDMQNRVTDGHTYKDRTEDSYPSREEWVANNAANSFLFETFRLMGKPSFSNNNVTTKNIVE